jgi:sodium-dependent phosphate cotransporter
VNPAAAPPAARPWVTALRPLLVLGLLYLFFLGLDMIGLSFKLFGKGFAEQLMAGTSDPFVGLVVGILATSLVQSSSTTTSMTVALVAAGGISLQGAIPIIMGANIGTSVTNILVSLGHINQGREFRRAFAAANVHDFFNVLAVLILFPLQLTTNFLGKLSTGFAEVFYDIGGLTFASPLKLATAPAVAGAARLIGHHPWLMLIVSLVLMFTTLRQLVVLLKALVISRVEVLFDEVIFRTAGRAMLFGLFITALVQSSSVTTSLAVPLAGAGILTIQQIFPYTLGANVGTTITAMLAALAVGEVHAVTVAFAHMLFNVCGIVVIWPIPAIRRLPIVMAERMTSIAMYNRVIPVLWVILFFFALPAAVIFILR